MDIQQIKQTIAEQNEEALFLDGFDEALIGIAESNGSGMRAAYSYSKIVDILMERDGMTNDEAIEFYDFNIYGSYMGKNSPEFISILRIWYE